MKLLLVGFLAGCAVTSAAGMGYWYYRRTRNHPPPPTFRQCIPAGVSSHFPLPYHEIDDKYVPPNTFDHRVNVLELDGRYCIGWRGASCWFSYPPIGACVQGDSLAVTLCLGGSEKVTYRVRPEGEQLAFTD